MTNKKIYVICIFVCARVCVRVCVNFLFATLTSLFVLHSKKIRKTSNLLWICKCVEGKRIWLLRMSCIWIVYLSDWGRSEIECVMEKINYHILCPRNNKKTSNRRNWGRYQIVLKTVSEEREPLRLASLENRLLSLTLFISLCALH